MIKNYLRIAFRNVFKRPGYAALNIAGLIIGLCCCLLIFQYVSYERSYDKFEPKASQIFRIRLDQYKQGQLQWQSATSYPGIGPGLKREYPEVEQYCRLIDWTGILANPKTNIKFNETKGYYADPSSIDMLRIQLVQGNPATALREPNQMIISETMAKKYFGNELPLGKHLETRNGNAPSNADLTYLVTGVFRDYPKNSHLIIDYVVSWASLESEMRARGDTSNEVNTSMGWYDFYTYLQLREGTAPGQFESKLAAFSEKYINSKDWNKSNNIKDRLFLIPLPDIYLHSDFNQEAEVNGNGQAVAFIFLIGFLIIGIAWINYVNFATARSVERAREVGVRKTLGALRTNLVRQFMLETIMLNLTALILSLVAAKFLSPLFNSMMGRTGTAAFEMSARYWLIFSAIFISGTLLSGLYPAFVLSAYRPVSVLKGIFKNSSGGLLLRKGLIILQFAISVILIAGTIIVYQQVNYMRSQKIGANIHQTLVLDGAQSLTDSSYDNSYQPFRNEILQLPSVKGITASSTVMGQEIYWTRGVKALEDASGSTAVTMYLLGIDYDFIPQYELRVIAGRNFSKDFPVDDQRKTVILNDEAVRLFGFKNASDAINKKLVLGDTVTVVGVVQGFHQLGLRKPIDPQMIVCTPRIRSNYSVKLLSADMPKSIAAIQAIWDRHFPNDPFSYFFLDDFYNGQYQSDQRFGKIFTLFAALAILIACFGLLGLSSYNILQRTKEIGIRKVLGASVQNVVFILSRDFLTLVIVSFVVAVPVAWIVMHSWLQDYAYRITIKGWVFLIACILSVIVALVTISFQAIKAAIANPVKSLRTE